MINWSQTTEQRHGRISATTWSWYGPISLPQIVPRDCMMSLWCPHDKFIRARGGRPGRVKRLKTGILTHLLPDESYLLGNEPTRLDFEPPIWTCLVINNLCDDAFEIQSRKRECPWINPLLRSALIFLPWSFNWQERPLRSAPRYY